MKEVTVNKLTDAIETKTEFAHLDGKDEIIAQTTELFESTDAELAEVAPERLDALLFEFKSRVAFVAENAFAHVIKNQFPSVHEIYVSVDNDPETLGATYSIPSIADEEGNDIDDEEMLDGVREVFTAYQFLINADVSSYIYTS